MKFIVDMNLSPLWCDLLRRSGWEAEHWTNVGAVNATDAQIMEWAKRNNVIVITHDLDFGAVLAAGGTTGPSVIQVRGEDPMPDAIGDIMVAAIKQFEDQLKQGAIVVVEPWRARSRILPLRPL